ncbi:hypothetical protein [Labrys miyagiensis]
MSVPSAPVEAPETVLPVETVTPRAGDDFSPARQAAEQLFKALVSRPSAPEKVEVPQEILTATVPESAEAATGPVHVVPAAPEPRPRKRPVRKTPVAAVSKVEVKEEAPVASMPPVKAKKAKIPAREISSRPDVEDPGATVDMMDGPDANRLRDRPRPGERWKRRLRHLRQS